MKLDQKTDKTQNDKLLVLNDSERAKKNKRMEMLQNGGVLATIMYISAPTVLGMFLATFASVIKAIIIGQTVGDLGLAGYQNFVPTEIFFFSNIITSLSCGATIPIARYLGENNLKKAQESLSNFFIVSIINSIALSLLFGTFLKEYLTFIGIPDKVLSFCIEYAAPVVWLAPLTYSMTIGMEAILVYENLSHISLFRNIISAMLNIASLLVLSYGFKLGTASAAYSQIFSNFVAGCYIMGYQFLSKQIPIKIGFFKICKHFSIKTILQIYYISLPTLTSFIPTAFRNIMATLVISKYGRDQEEVLKLQLIYAICSRVLQLVQMPINGLMSGFQPVLGFNLGAKNYGRVYTVIKISYFLLFMTTFTTVALILVFSPEIIPLFSRTESIHKEATFFLRIESVGFLFSVFLEVSAIILEHEKKQREAIALQSLRATTSLVFQILVPAITKRAEYMFYANIIGDIVGGLVGVFYTFYFFWKYHPKRILPLREVLQRK